MQPGMFGFNNYSACIGDGMVWTDRGGINDNGTPGNIAASDVHLRGVFRTRRATNLRDILDGTSNTIMVAENLVDVGYAKSPRSRYSCPLAIKTSLPIRHIPIA